MTEWITAIATIWDKISKHGIYRKLDPTGI